MPTEADQTSVTKLRLQLIHEQAATPHMFRELANMEALLADTYRDRVSYELLQNSDDAGSTKVDVLVSSDSIEWENDGHPLTLADVTSLCRSATSTKTSGQSIGYRGIGFKSVASIANSVVVSSADVTFTFDRTLTARAINVDDPASVPLIRVPSSIQRSPRVHGVRFRLNLDSSSAFIGPDPLSVLFLRNVERISTNGPTGDRHLTTVTRSKTASCVLTVDSRASSFQLLSASDVSVAIPLDESAIALVGSRGRLACFLPLDDRIGVPVVVSGNVLTDPSRRHAVPQDSSSLNVLTKAAQMVAAVLTDTEHPQFDRMWELLLLAPDMRAELVTHQATVSSTFLGELKNALRADPPAFAITPVSLQPADLAALFPAGAPKALYQSDNLKAAKLLGIALGLPGLDVSDISRLASAHDLAPNTRRELAERIVSLAGSTRTRLTERDRKFIEAAGIEPRDATASKQPRTQPRVPDRSTFPALIARWRSAEIAVAEWLNGRGWQLTDVSTQNMGYDLDGTDDQGVAVHVEVKKVDQPTSSFTVTTNEMATMQSSRNKYLLAVVVSAGEYSRMMLLDPNATDIPYDKVCRQWQYEFHDWARHGQWLS